MVSINTQKSKYTHEKNLGSNIDSVELVPVSAVTGICNEIQTMLATSKSPANSKTTETSVLASLSKGWATRALRLFGGPGRASIGMKTVHDWNEGSQISVHCQDKYIL